ncbi:hypothetical protein ABVK25_010717 [Lepraria finkii]|uniref:Uncharacterized protein n=1 Tax=Lepraria finkii TaxID=1340010 RepID=A0ABR4ATY1_9LECA
MPRSKSAISAFLASFKGQGYRSRYINGYVLAQFTELMNQLLGELHKIIFVRLHLNQRQWRGTRRELESLHIWFFKGRNGGIMNKPLKLGCLTLSTLLPGLSMSSEISHSEAQYQLYSQTRSKARNRDVCTEGIGSQTSILKATALALEQGQPSFETDTSSTDFTSNEHLPPNFSCEPFDQITSLTQGSLGQGYLPSFQLNDSPLFTNGRDTFYATSPTPNTPNTTVYHLQFRHYTLSMTCSTDLAVYHLVRLTTTDGLIQPTVPAPFLAQKKTFKTSGPMLPSTRNT